MSEVRKYKAIGDMTPRSRIGGGEWVRLEDYDAAQSELARVQKISDNYYALCVEGNQQLAALREELARCKHDIASFLETTAKVCDLLGIDTEDAKHAEGNPSDVLFIHATALSQRLTAAEQRNATLESWVRHFASCADVRQVGTLAMDFAASLAKPTESGASE